jgi:hypothetical protein
MVKSQHGIFSILTAEGNMDLTTWGLIWVAILAVGVGVAYLFGRFVQGGENPGQVRPGIAAWYMRRKGLS